MCHRPESLPSLPSVSRVASPPHVSARGISQRKRPLTLGSSSMCATGRLKRTVTHHNRQLKVTHPGPASRFPYRCKRAAALLANRANTHGRPRPFPHITVEDVCRAVPENLPASRLTGLNSHDVDTA